MPTRRYTIRMKPTARQVRLFWRLVGSRRHVWNWALEKVDALYAENGKVTAKDWLALSRDFTEYRNTEATWLLELNYKATVSVLRDLRAARDRAIANSVKRIRVGPKHNPYGFPRPKKRGRGNAGFWMPSRTRVDGNRLVLFKERVRLMRELPVGDVGASVRIKHSGGKWYASFTVTTPDTGVALVEPSNLVGIDIGLKDYAILSDGTTIANPRFFCRMHRKLKHWQRKLARQKEGSGRRFRTKQRIAKIHAGIANRRKHYAHLQSRRIADTFDAACIESHSLKSQARGRLAKSVHDAGHGSFRHNLKYKLPDRGKQLIEADPFFPSTKQCSSCGELNNAITLSTRKWTCPACNVAHDRDLNAANNLEAYGREQVAADELNET